VLGVAIGDVGSFRAKVEVGRGGVIAAVQRLIGDSPLRLRELN